MQARQSTKRRKRFRSREKLETSGGKNEMTPEERSVIQSATQTSLAAAAAAAAPVAATVAIAATVAAAAVAVAVIAAAAAAAATGWRVLTLG